MSKPSKYSGQLPISLPLEPALSRDDLIVSPANALATQLIDNWPDWHGPVAILAGPTGSGKSHIGQIWAKQASAEVITCAEMALKEMHLKAPVNVLLEDVSADDLDENALFHLINHVRANASYLMITTSEWPAAWQLKLPDLASRIRAAQLVELHEPDDALLRQVLVKLFSDRQLIVELNVIDYCLLRMERSLQSAQRLVDLLDSEALARGSRITRALARDILENEGQI